MPLTQEERRDLGLLRNLLQVIGAFLSWLVGDSPFIPAELRQAFIRVLPLVSLRLANAASELEGIETTDSHLWRRLDDAGLVGDALSLKRDIWERTTAASFPTVCNRVLWQDASAPVETHQQHPWEFRIRISCARTGQGVQGQRGIRY